MARPDRAAGTVVKYGTTMVLSPGGGGGWKKKYRTDVCSLIAGSVVAFFAAKGWGGVTAENAIKRALFFRCVEKHTRYKRAVSLN